ncbi:MAG: acetyl-CoA carboxylase biotin carboxyl carrier protein [Saccharofermentans sp.]|nr:acetyl-CoA carboxylase biotin carboxyl carrier protein [Saccharofermentans sp.]
MADKNSRTGLSLDEMTDLIKAVSDSGIDSFEYKEGDFQISLKGGRAYTAAAPVAMPATLSMPDLSMAMATAAEAATGDDDDEDNMFVIKSPLVGTFYAAPAQDASPFVKIGDRVKKGQVLAIVEAMKMMNDIESDCDGTIAEICVKNGEAVEFGQALFKIN